MSWKIVRASFIKDLIHYSSCARLAHTCAIVEHNVFVLKPKSDCCSLQTNSASFNKLLVKNSNQPPVGTQSRFLHLSSRCQKKQQKRPGREDDDSDDEDSDDEDDTDPQKDWQEKSIEVINNQLSTIVQKGMGMSRKNAEELISSGKIRINGKMPAKKASEVYVEDVIDNLLGPHPDNEKFMSVNRIEIAHQKTETTKKGRFLYTIKLRKHLMCDEYKA